MKFYGKIEEGRLKVFDRKSMEDFISSLDGKRVTVIIDKHGSRTGAQNALYWVYIGIISQELGYTKEEMHEVVKYKFLKRKKIDTNGEVLEYLKSTTKLNKEEFMDLINGLQIWAAQALGVVLPDPQEQLKIV